MGRLIALLALLLLGCGGFEPDLPALVAEARTSTPTWSHEIRILLYDRCVECHTSDGLSAGGVEVDDYAVVRAGAQHDACVSISEELRATFRESLLAPPTAQRVGDPACSDWEPLSMPPGALPKFTPLEQVTFARWLEAGSPP